MEPRACVVQIVSIADLDVVDPLWIWTCVGSVGADVGAQSVQSPSVVTIVVTVRLSVDDVEILVSEFPVLASDVGSRDIQIVVRIIWNMVCLRILRLV